MSTTTITAQSLDCIQQGGSGQWSPWQDCFGSTISNSIAARSAIGMTAKEPTAAPKKTLLLCPIE